MDVMISMLTVAEAVIIPINSATYNATAILVTLDAQTFEYRQSMDAYLSLPSLGGTHPTTLNQLYHRSRFLTIPSQYSYVLTSLTSSPSNASYPNAQLGIQNLTIALRNTFTSYTLNAIIYPEQKNLVVKIGSPSQSSRNGILAALTDSPVVTVPASFSNATADAPIGIQVWHGDPRGATERGEVSEYCEFGRGVESCEAHAGICEWDRGRWRLFCGAEREA